MMFLYITAIEYVSNEMGWLSDEESDDELSPEDLSAMSALCK